MNQEVDRGPRIHKFPCQLFFPKGHQCCLTSCDLLTSLASDAHIFSQSGTNTSRDSPISQCRHPLHSHGTSEFSSPHFVSCSHTVLPAHFSRSNALPALFCHSWSAPSSCIFLNACAFPAALLTTIQRPLASSSALSRTMSVLSKRTAASLLLSMTVTVPCISSCAFSSLSSNAHCRSAAICIPLRARLFQILPNTL